MQDNPSHFRTIRLTPGQEADGSWRCQYAILEGGSTPTDQRVGYPEGTFATLTEAVAAARNAAQRIIDSFKPTA